MERRQIDMVPKFLELHSATRNNTSVTINIDQIKFITPEENGTFIKLEGDDQIHATETYDEVMDIFRKIFDHVIEWRKETDESV